MKLRPLLVLITACAAALFSMSAVVAQSQGIGLTVEAPAASPAAPSAGAPSSGSPSDGSTVPASSSGGGNGTVHGTTATPGGTGRPMPRTGLNVLRLLAMALGSITLGQVLLGWARRTGSSTA